MTSTLTHARARVGSKAGLSGPKMSATAYFSWVALATVLGFAVAALLRPNFAYTLKETFGLAKPLEPAPQSFYAVRVAPLLQSHCAGCHGERRQKGKLRLDSFAALMRGGKHGAVIQPGNVQGSELTTRMTLPASDKKAMPPEGRTPLKEDEVKVIKLWIAAGASHVLPVDAIKGAPPPSKEVKFVEVDPAAVEKARLPLAAAVQKLQARFPGIIAYQARSSADLEVNASLLGQAFGDAQLAELSPLRERIVRADFSGTKITDAAAAQFAGMKNLRMLRLVNTAITDTTVKTLAQIKSLQSLAVVGTGVTPSALQPLRNRGVKVYDENGNQQSAA